MSSARRTFLKQAGLGVGALAASATPLLADSTTPTGRPTRTELLAAAAHWDELQSQQQAEPWDTSWAQKITGKYKAMFDVPEVEGGVGVMRAGIWQRQYTDVLKAKPADFSTVIVIRHAGIVLAMNQEFWTTYNVGKQRKLKDAVDTSLDEHTVVITRPLTPLSKEAAQALGAEALRRSSSGAAAFASAPAPMATSTPRMRAE
jgi:hypothetical protein